MLIKTRIEPGANEAIFRTDLTAADARFFGTPKSTRGRVTVVEVDGDLSCDSNGFLEFEVANAVLLNLGAGADVYVMSLGGNRPEAGDGEDAVKPNGTQTIGRGDLLDNDQRFLMACEHERLPDHVQCLARELP